MNPQPCSQPLDDLRSGSADVSDARLEADCLQLLGRLEALIERLDPARRAGDWSAALEAGKEMLVELLEFLTQQFGSDSVASELPRIRDLRDSIREAQTLLTRAFWKRLLRRHDGSDELIRQAYRQIGDEFAAIFGSLLSGIDGRFHAPATTAEWQCSSRILLEDFRQHW